jgi:hypothetical protein
MPGGSVLHTTRAAAPRDMRIGVVTAAGPEPAALLGVEELRRAAAWVECAEAEATITFRHRESKTGRRLWLERTGATLDHAVEIGARRSARAVLVAPVAGEINADSLHGWDRTWTRGAILQGWLRQAAADGEVQPLALAELPDEVIDALRRFDLLVASREDLRADASEPRGQLEALRVRVGDGPTLVVTDGADGVWIRAPAPSGQADVWHLPVPWRVDGVESVGSGDIFAAFMLAGEWPRSPDRPFITERAELAMRVVAEVLEGRRA